MTVSPPLRIAVLVSGSGTNLQAIIDAIETGSLNARIACIISNIPNAFALTRAVQHGITAVVFDHTRFANRRSYDSALLDTLKQYQVELVVMAGFMRILSEVVIGAFPNRIMNIHPALLPSFPGLHAQKQALEHGVRFSGCTIHFVDSGTDTGPIILQAVVPVEQEDTEATLSARIQKEEHRLYPEAIRLFASGKITVCNRIVRIAV